MRPIQYIGITISLLIFTYGIWKFHIAKYRRIDLLINILISIALVAVSIYPAVGDIPAQLFGMQTQIQTRWFAVLFISNMILFGLFFYALSSINNTKATMGELVRALARMESEKRYTVDTNHDSIFIVIPAYNEEKAIRGVLKDMPDSLFDHKVYPLVVVDGANDKTEMIVRRENYMVVSHLMNRGQGDALRTGFDIALNSEANIVMTMDADGQHLPGEIERLVVPILEDEADYVQGSRFLGKYDDRGSIRHVGIILLTLVINILGRMNITDCASGFRAIRGNQLALLDLREKQFSAAEILIEASRKGLRIKEIPITITNRSYGKSKKPEGLSFPLGYLRTAFTTWLR